MNRASGNSVLGMCGFGVRRELRRHYGSGEAAAVAVKEAMKDTEAIEQWASIVTAKQERISSGPDNASEAGELSISRNGQPFSFTEIPSAMRPAAIECLAAAMLAWTAEREREASA